MSQNLLMIEDDTRLAGMVAQYLEQSGFAVQHAADGRSGLACLDTRTATAPDLVILDLMLPDIDGLEVCRRIRTLPAPLAQLPILMLTAKGDAMDRIIGLEIGADDYLPKPFEPRELLARIRAILRRKVDSPAPSSQTLRFGSLEIDRDARVVRVGDVPSELTSYQFDLLLALAERAGRVLTRDQIMEAVRGRELDAFDRSIDVHMGRIRAAIEADPKAPKRILTVRGVGYVFARHQVVSSAKYSTRGAFVIPTSWRIGVGAKSTNCDRLGNREFAVYAIDPRWQIKRPACGRTVDAGLHGHCGGKNATDVRHDARANRDPLRDGLYVNAVRGAFCCEPRFAFIHQSPPEVISARERRRTKHDRDRDVAGIRHIRGQRYARQSKWIVVARGTEPKFDA